MTDRMADLSFQKSFTDPHQPADLLFSDSCPPSAITIQLNSDRLLNERPIDDFDDEMPDWESAMDMPNERDVYQSRFPCTPEELRSDMGLKEIDNAEAQFQAEPILGKSCSPPRTENGDVETQDAVSPIRDSSPPCRQFKNERTPRRRFQRPRYAEKLSPTVLPDCDGDCPFFSFEDRQNVYEKHYSLINDWQYSKEERLTLRNRIENLCREHCMAYSILAQMLLTPDELPGCRDTNPWPDNARQSLLVLTVGDHWAIHNLAILVALADKINLEDHSTRFFSQILLPFHDPDHHFWSENACLRKFINSLRRILLED
ncbi:Hypothetical protein NTJ_13149 [Nesidiocoris tenuis]|uniref:Uncharacterized protein n=1 Tax=Nesidiocoris tenuis TaxID=355587 RepID=A0ABN7B7I9_9HEMI|nr:Hypothetical protein NTJ_13149 [Nesidiocoris tenuis]